MNQSLRNRLISATILLLAVAAVAQPVSAQEIKLGFINAEKVLQSYSGYKDAQAQFGKQSESWSQELDSRSRELKAMEEDFKAQALMLTDDKKRQKLTALEQGKRDLEQYYQQIFGPNGESARKQEELLAPIYDKVNQIIRELGKQENYTMIFDSSALGVAYAADGVDITDKVIERLGKAE